MSGLKALRNGKILGGFPNIKKAKFIDAKNTERKKYRLGGDKAEVYKVQILRKYPFPTFHNEKFLSEDAVWNKIAIDGYKIRWYPKVIYLCDYLGNGLTKDENKYINSFDGFTYVTKISLEAFHGIYKIRPITKYIYYAIVSSVVSYLGLHSFGFSGAYIRFYSKYKVKNEENEIARLNGMFMTVFLSISVVCVLCGIVMVENSDRIFGGGLTIHELEKAKVLMGIMIFNMALSFPNSIFDCCITAHEQFVFQRLVNVTKSLLNPFITFPLLIVGYGSVSVVLVSTFLLIVSFLLNVWYVLKKLGERFLFRGFRFGLLKEMWIFTFFIFLNSIIDQINWSVDKFLLGRFSGTVSVAVYQFVGRDRIWCFVLCSIAADCACYSSVDSESWNRDTEGQK